MMDPATLIGLAIAFGGVFFLMTAEGVHLSAILLPGPLAIVFIGSLGAGIAGGALRDAIHAFKTLPKAFTAKAPKRGATMAAIDGADPEDLRTRLEDRIDTKRAQDRVASGFFNALGGYAPTIGIIGTVISLVHVLENLSDPSTLGPMIAAAFVATLWGILSANLVFLPIGSRLKRISDLECAQMEISLEGLLALQAGANPRTVGERLRSMVPAGELVDDAGQAA